MASTRFFTSSVILATLLLFCWRNLSLLDCPGINFTQDQSYLSLQVQNGPYTATNHEYYQGITKCRGRHLESHHKRGKKYLSSRLSYYSNAVASFQITRLASYGDISQNPGPAPGGNGSTKCSVCQRTVARNHRAVSCDQCNLWCHIKCGGIHTSQYKHLQSSTESSWSCHECLWTLNSLPFANVSNIEGELNVTDLSHDLDDSWRSMTDGLQEGNGNDKDSLISHRQAHPNLLFLAHLNINSLQSKFDELQLINNRLRAGILVLTETKIDSSYPDSQFKLSNYRLYRQEAGS